MIRSLIKLNLQVLFVAFSVTWINEAVAVLVNDRKYEVYEVFENNTEESNFENKLKTLFIGTVALPNALAYDSIVPNRINALDLFKAKESHLKNSTPPPEGIA
ncbi:hypothetical protein [Flavobacterium sp. LB2P53]|uniref:hypothetical protein n=1 Tax=Flavobacterium sp. LB2P53 TaxID=2497481 RepID=UPI000F841B29|nr:hypothetical protein [Flavobacterium sp. LB2P53]RTY68192.1 hypothetical protein EKL95_07795 [Flavobacterium sp. LB2P53]